MRKLLKLCLLPVLALCVAIAFAACNNDKSEDTKPAATYPEVAGTYELTYISGTIGYTQISNEMYEYYTIILTEDGNATVRSKGAGVGGVVAEGKGKFTYSDGVIRMTSSINGISVTEEYEYEDGVITYTVNNSQMNFTLIVTRV